MLKRFILWDYKRGSWQYDVMVGAILAFLFLTPGEWFGDKPRFPKITTIAMLPSENGSSPFYVDGKLLNGVPDNLREQRLTQLLQSGTSDRRLKILRLEPVTDTDGEAQGYLVFARP
jgi:hypothetical protein